jgi:ABC-type dipeptide/oligopeptide/nickel transport system permease component
MSRADYITKRALFAIVTAFLAITLNFVIFRAAPGDASSTLSKCRNCTPAFRDALRADLGLDKSKVEQYFIYIKELAQGNLGHSFVNRRPVSNEVFRSLLKTLPMVALGAAFGLILGILLGVVTAWRRGTWADWGGLSAALMLSSLPVQWLGLMLIVLCGGILPTSGISDPYLELTNPGALPALVDRVEHMILPSLTIGLVSLGGWALIVRSALLDTLGEDYIMTARAKGLSSWTIVRRHALRNSLLPIVTLVALTLGYLVAGTILVESVFSYPGIGLTTYEAVLNRDYPVLQGSFLILTMAVIAANFAADLLYFKLDPRISQ